VNRQAGTITTKNVNNRSGNNRSGNNRAENGRSLAIRLNRALYWMSRRWLLVVTLIIGIWVGLPWLAPVFMARGWNNAGSAIQLLYAVQCHQLPQRSFFLFGEKPMYALSQIQNVWGNSNNPLVLRQFIGNSQMGWKVAWSDRMVYMYSSPILWGLLYWPLRKRIKPLSWQGLALLLLPMALDGFTHMISDLTAGIGLGFRDNNAWLTTLTNQTFPATFYTGDALGSFNSWTRLITGLLFGLGVVWFFYPRLHESFSNTARQIEVKFKQSGLKL
jgi:uncharacterized membrane protein